VYDLGDGTVLRRTLRRENLQREAAVMRHARAHGYPVPDVVEIRPDGLVLERIEGPTMALAMRRRPWRISRCRISSACAGAFGALSPAAEEHLRAIKQRGAAADV
jgi:hypothetical protein